MPRPAVPKPGFSLLRLHNSQNPHRIATLSPAAKTSLIDSVAQDIEGCIYAIGYYTDSGVLSSQNTMQFDQVMQKIKSEEKRALRKIVRKARAYKKMASEANRGFRKIRRLIKKERRQRDFDSDAVVEQASASDHEECVASTQLVSSDRFTSNNQVHEVALAFETLQNTQDIRVVPYTNTIDGNSGDVAEGA